MDVYEHAIMINELLLMDRDISDTDHGFSKVDTKCCRHHPEVKEEISNTGVCPRYRLYTLVRLSKSSKKGQTTPASTSTQVRSFTYTARHQQSCDLITMVPAVCFLQDHKFLDSSGLHNVFDKGDTWLHPELKSC